MVIMGLVFLFRACTVKQMKVIQLPLKSDEKCSPVGKIQMMMTTNEVNAVHHWPVKLAFSIRFIWFSDHLELNSSDSSNTPSQVPFWESFWTVSDKKKDAARILKDSRRKFGETEKANWKAG